MTDNNSTASGATKVIKRFIAGAVCPRCSELDKIVMYRQDTKDFRACVACGFVDEMRFTAPARELETRVNLSAEDKVAQTQVIKIFGAE